MTTQIASLQSVRQQILNSPKPFSLEVVRLNWQQNTGSSILTARSAVLLKY